MRIESVKEAIGICYGEILADERTDVIIRQMPSGGFIDLLEIRAKAPEHTEAVRISTMILEVIEMIESAKEASERESFYLKSTIWALYGCSNKKFLGFTITEIIESILINLVIEGKANKAKMSDFIAGLNIPQLMIKFLKYTEHIDSKNNFDL